MAPADVSGERAAPGRSVGAFGAVTPDWSSALSAVPRSGFLPEVFWAHDMASGESTRVDRRTEPETWARLACADVPLVTQWDDGEGGGPGGVPTSSASMPTVVFRMLAALDVRPHDRVLEIGTGTGWNAGLLAARLGAGNVTSIEIDPQVADAARDRLAAAGLLGTVLTRDGALGDPAGAPFDRVIVTAGVRKLPPAWIEQTREGGLIVAPWGTHYSNADAIVRLEVADGEASGEFVGPAEFMKLRAQRLPFPGHEAYVPNGVDSAEHTKTEVTEADLLGAGRFDATAFVLGLRVPRCHQAVAPKRDGSRPVWFYGLTDRSWACVMLHDGHDADVWQAGPRRLWDEVSQAIDWWREAGRPGIERFGLAVRADGGQLAWLDDPEDAWPV
ncbi:protein-L-isoaspartate O-methyltransferase [Streptomyces sp. BK022]|uniref:methyltransferase domain-containing protein n=1 Tax=Streptomyces sp. BK022 TaxID=2512123 RepID=UPI00102A24B8|nr:methyltransferase domain-containing protein [Streptomyces sp. BK022]RZU37762.1 protein-L-isoaspartate O-methyltransferase [Streptomyces sp. BK022]